jgi:hypothetical protein
MQNRTERHCCPARYHLILEKSIIAVTRRVTTANQVRFLPFDAYTIFIAN